MLTGKVLKCPPFFGSNSEDSVPAPQLLFGRTLNDKSDPRYWGDSSA